VPASASFWTSLRVVLGHEAGPVYIGLTAAQHVAVDLVQVQQHDRQVALRVLLLVDGERDLAVDDGLHGVTGQVDGADRDVAAHRVDGRLGRAGGDVGVQGEDRVDARVGLELGLDLGLALGQVGQAGGQLQVLDVAEGVLRPVAALLQTDVVGLLDRAEDLGRAELLELLTGAWPAMNSSWPTWVNACSSGRSRSGSSCSPAECLRRCLFHRTINLTYNFSLSSSYPFYLHSTLIPSIYFTNKLHITTYPS
jgi:hypothetical protein